MPSLEILNTITRSLQDSAKITLFSLFKTNNPLIDTLVSTAIITCFTYIINQCCYSSNTNNFLAGINLYDQIASLFYKKNMIILEGTQSSVVTHFHGQLINNSAFTDTFKAVFHNIINNIEENSTVREIKEFALKDEYDAAKSSSAFDGYVVSQSYKFVYNKELHMYARAEITKQEMSGEKSKCSAMVNVITIKIYSYVTPLSVMQEYLQKITNDYLDTVENSRANKKFIYNLCNIKCEESRFDCWKEYTFESTRTFDNIFFEGKEDVLKKIRFFLDNPGWYYDMGVPYTLGFGLHGPPGTGKTSFFKCLANLTGRHLVILSLKLIKTKSQLDQFFFENRYTFKNRENSVGFDKKIIIMEDIDCLGDIVLKRETANTTKRSTSTKKKTGIENAVQLILDKNEEQAKLMEATCKISNEDEPITLDDILNLWDGLKETPGRILGISSNHYEKLDPALIRPGRIDITLKLDYASREIIQQMYRHFYKTEISKEILDKVPNKKYSPAQIINYYMLFRDEPENFIKKLQNE